MNPRTLTITAAEWASVRDGSLWLVQEADVGQGGLLYPPVEFVEACAPCETCGDERAVFCPDCGERGPRECVGDGKPHVDCPDCRIELVRPCPRCKGAGFLVNDDGYRTLCSCGGGRCISILGHAYAVGQPLPIVGYYIGQECIVVSEASAGHCIPGTDPERYMIRDIPDRLTHYGPPESLVGKWAMELRRVS